MKSSGYFVIFLAAFGNCLAQNITLIEDASLPSLTSSITMSSLALLPECPLGIFGDIKVLVDDFGDILSTFIRNNSDVNSQALTSLQKLIHSTFPSLPDFAQIPTALSNWSRDIVTFFRNALDKLNNILSTLPPLPTLPTLPSVPTPENSTNLIRNWLQNVRKYASNIFQQLNNQLPPFPNIPDVLQDVSRFVSAYLKNLQGMLSSVIGQTSGELIPYLSTFFQSLANTIVTGVFPGLPPLPALPSFLPFSGLPSLTLPALPGIANLPPLQLPIFPFIKVPGLPPLPGLPTLGSGVPPLLNLSSLPVLRDLPNLPNIFG